MSFLVFTIERATRRQASGAYTPARSIVHIGIQMEIFFTVDLYPISKQLRVEVFNKRGKVCTYCRSVRADTIDHIVPLSRGGHNVIQNLVPACRQCNSSKGDLLLTEWKPNEYELCPDNCHKHNHLGEI